MRVLFIGFGSVAKEMARILTHSHLYPRLDFSLKAVGIFTARHGGVEDKNGIDLARVLDNFNKYGGFAADGGGLSCLTPLAAAMTLDYDVLVELSVLSIEGRGEPAASYIRAALARGKSVVSANKGPVAFVYRELKELARENAAEYLFESAVMDGAPVFNLYERCMKGAAVTGFSGILNGTTNFILSQMEIGTPFEEALRQAQDAGIAEADPSMDVDGWDPAAKAAALANVLMGADLTPLDVRREGIRHVTPASAQDALKRGFRLKLICRGWKEDGDIRTGVMVEEIPQNHVFATVSHFGSALRIEADLMHPNIIVQECPDLTDTAFGVIEDLISVESRLSLAR